MGFGWDLKSQPGLSGAGGQWWSAAHAAASFTFHGEANETIVESQGAAGPLALAAPTAGQRRRHAGEQAVPPVGADRAAAGAAGWLFAVT